MDDIYMDSGKFPMSGSGGTNGSPSPVQLQPGGIQVTPLYWTPASRRS